MVGSPASVDHVRSNDSPGLSDVRLASKRTMRGVMAARPPPRPPPGAGPAPCGGAPAGGAAGGVPCGACPAATPTHNASAHATVNARFMCSSTPRALRLNLAAVGKLHPAGDHRRITAFGVLSRGLDHVARLQRLR